MGTIAFVFLLLGDHVREGNSWSVTPMPNMIVCEAVIKHIDKYNGGWSAPDAQKPEVAECIEVKQ